MFNPGIFSPDVQQKYKDHFTNKGWLAIDDILHEEYITHLYESVPNLNYDLERGLWYDKNAAFMLFLFLGFFIFLLMLLIVIFGPW